MPWMPAAAAAVFAVTFILLAMGKFGRWRVSRGVAALVGGGATGALLGLPLSVIDWQVLLLLGGLMALAGMAASSGLFEPAVRRLGALPTGGAIWASCWIVALASAAVLNDAAVVVLLPVLVPLAIERGVRVGPFVALLAVAANIGSVLTPFGNPQNAVLARTAGLGVADFIAAQWPGFALGIAALGGASAWLARSATSGDPRAEARPVAAPWTGRRTASALAVATFVAAASFRPAGIGLGTAAAACAGALYLWSRATGEPAVTAHALRAVDVGVLALFVGLYPLTAGLDAWFPGDWGPSRLGGLPAATGATVALSNVVGNVPTVLLFSRLDAAWTAGHAAFLVAASTLGGALLLTGSAANLIAADKARALGHEVGFGAFARWALPTAGPALAVAAAWTWPG